MTQSVVRILLVEDDQGHVGLIRRAFKKRGGEMALTTAETLAEARTVLAESLPDLVLTDVRLPDGDGLDLLPPQTESAPFPVIVMTGFGDQQTAVEAMKAGAADYVVKSREALADMPHVVDRALRQWEHLSARRRAEDALRQAHAELERRVEQRTAELADANEQLRQEIEQRKRADDALRKEQALLRQLLDLQERDRKLVAFEIHDGLAQQLSAVQMMLQTLRNPELRRSEGAAETVENLLGMLNGSLDETRRLIGGLRPPGLDESGVLAAVSWLMNDVRRRQDVQVEFVHGPGLDRLAPPLEAVVFRIVQESLNNACRHGQSGRVRVELDQSDGRLRLSIRDWGVGFDPQAVKPDRFGLTGIRERARLFGGTATIDSTPGQGTQVTVELPLVEDLLSDG